MDERLLGRGFPFPLSLRAGGLALEGGPQKVEQSIRLILETSPGERLMRAGFGCGARDLVFEANTATLRGLVATRVREALAREEPRIEVVEVRVAAAGSLASCLLIEIDYRLPGDNSLFNFVYPFFLTEGAATPAGARGEGR